MDDALLNGSDKDAQKGSANFFQIITKTKRQKKKFRKDEHSALLKSPRAMPEY